jgi:hypothetical protein
MFPEHRLLEGKLNSFNTIVIQEPRLIIVGTDLSAVIMWVGLGLCAAVPHALWLLCTCQLDLARVTEFRSI